MIKLRRGFKSQAAGLAGELRAELGLSPFDRLDPHQLAAHLAIPIVPLSELAARSDGARHSLSTDSDFFSALTVFDGYRRMIVHNDAHSEVRQSSNLAHELAHGLLLHEPAPPLDGVTGCRIWNDTNEEEEAAWLSGESPRECQHARLAHQHEWCAEEGGERAGALLVTGKMALAVARGRFTEQQTLQRLRVSASMLDWRINMSGARKRVGRERASERRFLILSSVEGRTGQNQEQGPARWSRPRPA